MSEKHKRQTEKKNRKETPMVHMEKLTQITGNFISAEHVEKKGIACCSNRNMGN